MQSGDENIDDTAMKMVWIIIVIKDGFDMLLSETGLTITVRRSSYERPTTWTGKSEHSDWPLGQWNRTPKPVWTCTTTWTVKQNTKACMDLHDHLDIETKTLHLRHTASISLTRHARAKSCTSQIFVTKVMFQLLKTSSTVNFCRSRLLCREFLWLIQWRDNNLK